MLQVASVVCLFLYGIIFGVCTSILLLFQRIIASHIDVVDESASLRGRGPSSRVGSR